MKLLHFNDFQLGVLRGENVIDISAILDELPHTGPEDRIKGLIERFDEYRDRIEAEVAQGPGFLRLEQLQESAT